MHRLLRTGTLILWISSLFMPLAAQQPPSKRVPPGINDTWRSERIDPLIDRLEVESREVYLHRNDIAALVGPPPGAAIADVGAGSGFMSLLFARLVGPQGKVYAVDINAKMMGHVAQEAAEQGLRNVETVVCDDRSTKLPRNSVDIVFICDTYHHFEHPESTMRSIAQALRPGGQVVLVDFKRKPGFSPEWILGHVRAGKEVFAQEIIDAGFRLANDHPMEFLPQNYVLRFIKKD